METGSNAVIVQEANKRTIRILLVFCLLLCFIFVSVGFGSFSFMNYLVEQSQAATATGQAIATATGISHATQIAGYEIYDDFKSNPHHWDTGIENNEYWYGNIRVSDGMYVWDIRKVKDEDFYSWREYEQEIAIQDFDLSVDAKLDEGSSDALCYGVAFRASPRDLDSGAYIFSVCESGVYQVEYNNEVDGSEEIIPWTRSQAIRQGSSNTMSVRARGENVTLFINNMVVGEFSDKHVIEGYVYLLVRKFDHQPGIVHFDNFAFQPR